MLGRKHRESEKLFIALSIVGIVIPLLLLVVLIGDVTIRGSERLSWKFLTSFMSAKAESAGILPAIVGSVYLIGLTAAIAIPIGIGAAVYLEEYGKRNWITNLVEVNISNLAGVPSIIYGLLGLGIFVQMLSMGRSLIAGACTMALLILPIVIMSTREALKTVPDSMREACYGLGSSKWQAIRQVILPTALPGILTGAILSISRAIGETAPLIPIGAVAYIAFLPEGIDSPFTVLPLQIFNWVSRPQHEFAINAAAGIVVLLATLLILNSFAIITRNRYQKRMM